MEGEHHHPASEGDGGLLHHLTCANSVTGGCSGPLLRGVVGLLEMWNVIVDVDSIKEYRCGF